MPHLDVFDPLSEVRDQRATRLAGVPWLADMPVWPDRLLALSRRIGIPVSALP